METDPTLTQPILISEQIQRHARFSVGICAADHATGIDELIDIIESEPYPAGLTLDEIIIVASAIDPASLAFIRTSAKEREKLIIMEERTRKGKAEAINRIIQRARGEFLVLINSDARPEPGAISKLFNVIIKDSRVGVISASPMINDQGGITGAILKLIWEVHNECLATLNEGGQNNHCCDELVILRSEAICTLPDDTVNDGAFLAGVAHRAGYTVLFCEEARVSIDVPTHFNDFMGQRRRILYGHLQIFRTVGESPRTLESLMLRKPKLGLSILVRTLSRFPRLTLALPVAIVGECVSMLCAAVDNLTPSKKHVPWKRVGSLGL